jgi:prepilin-type N-terminal cleavage/methylation domain-containing protein
MIVNNKNSFSLIELIVVVSILGLLFSIVLTKNKIIKNNQSIVNFKINLKKINKSFFYTCFNKQQQNKCYYIIDNKIIEDENTLFKNELPIKYKKIGNSFVEDKYFILHFNNYLYSEKTIFKYENNFYLMKSENMKLIMKKDLNELNELYFDSNTNLNNIDIGL